MINRIVFASFCRYFGDVPYDISIRSFCKIPKGISVCLVSWRLSVPICLAVTWALHSFVFFRDLWLSEDSRLPVFAAGTLWLRRHWHGGCYLCWYLIYRHSPRRRCCPSLANTPLILTRTHSTSSSLHGSSEMMKNPMQELALAVFSHLSSKKFGLFTKK